MWKQTSRSERGQTLIIVTVAVVILLAIAGLAIDGGTVYLSRRRMQNASDASSLAGTRLLSEAICDTSAADDAAIAAAVAEYAQVNGVDGADALRAEYITFSGGAVVPFSPEVLVGGGTIPQGATGISATTSITRPTYFLGLLGQYTGAARGSAIAVTGPLLAGGGVRPFGVPKGVVDQLDPGDPDRNSFTLDFGNKCDYDPPAGGESACSLRYEGSDEPMQHRGWLNLDYVWNQGEDPDWPRAPRPANDCTSGQSGSGSGSELKCWMDVGSDGYFYADCPWVDGCRYGDYLHAVPGTTVSAIIAAEALEGEEEDIIVPVYDRILAYENIPPPKPEGVSQGSSYYYHIVGFAAIRITDAQRGGTGGRHTITADLVETFIGEGQVSPLSGSGYGESGACQFHLQVISLWD
jgi:hypothetical protein